MNKGGRIILDKDGKEIQRLHLDPHKAGHTPEDVKASHSYDLEAGAKFNGLKPAAPAAAQAAAPAVNKEGK